LVHLLYEGFDVFSSVCRVSFAIRLVFLAARGSARKVARVFRTEDFDAFSYNLCEVMAVGTPRAEAATS